MLRNMSMEMILGIESSCDETAAAVVAGGRYVVSNVVASQVALHEKYGGVVPEIAARAHIENIIPVISEAMSKAGVSSDDLDAVAVAYCPGLGPALLIGVTAAKVLAWSWHKPLIGVNHLHGHLQSVMLEEDQDCFPAVALVVSGGHTSIYHCRGPLSLELMGRTRDDAAGEAFDKVAMVLQLPYPGGPSIEKQAAKGDPKAIAFPRTYLEKDSLDFSFSGIKTAVLYHCRGQDMRGRNRVAQMSEQEKSDIAASFQAAVVDVLVGKTMMAAQQTGTDTVLLGGGVAANSALREALREACVADGRRLVVAAREHCTDNAAMVAGLGYHLLQAGMVADLTLEARPTGRQR